jgi:hypothetical protein
MAPQPCERVLVVVPTHTTRHLACCLAALQTQTHPPDAVCLSIDNAQPEIAQLAKSPWLQVSSPPPLTITSRPFRDVASLNQVRNNALRALDATCHIRESDLILVVDGDTALHPSAIGIHKANSLGVTTAYRYDLDEQTTSNITEHTIRQGGLASVDQWVSNEQVSALCARHERHLKQVRLRSMPLLGRLQKAHKPKLLGGHHAVRADLLRAINGYDEAYIGYGYDDDDLAVRLNALWPRPEWSVVTKDALAFHLWHPTRAPQRPTAAPGYTIFRQKRPAVAQIGWMTPDEQDEPSIEVIGD